MVSFGWFAWEYKVLFLFFLVLKTSFVNSPLLSMVSPLSSIFLYLSYINWLSKPKDLILWSLLSPTNPTFIFRRNYFFFHRYHLSFEEKKQKQKGSTDLLGIVHTHCRPVKASYMLPRFSPETPPVALPAPQSSALFARNSATLRSPKLLPWLIEGPPRLRPGLIPDSSLAWSIATWPSSLIPHCLAAVQVH